MFSLLAACLLSVLLLLTVALTTLQSTSGNWLTLILHYPLFWLLAWLLVARLQAKYQLTVVGLSLPLIVVEYLSFAG